MSNLLQEATPDEGNWTLRLAGWLVGVAVARLSIIVWLLREQRLPGLIEIPFPPRFSLLAAPASSQLILSSLFLGGITFLSSPARSLLTTPARSLSAGGSL